MMLLQEEVMQYYLGTVARERSSDEAVARERSSDEALSTSKSVDIQTKKKQLQGVSQQLTAIQEAKLVQEVKL